MQSIKLAYLIMVLIFVTEVMTNQCSAGTNTNLLRSLTFYSGDRNVHDIEYDQETGDFFYFGWIWSSGNKHTISRMDYAGNLIWSKAYYTCSACYPIRDTLQYSPTNHVLYYIVRQYPFVLVRFNSSTGNYLGGYQISGAYFDTFYNWDYSQCKLSNDELAYFCNIPDWYNVRYIVRFNTTSFQIDRASIYYARGYGDYSILPISKTEVLYSYREYYNPYLYRIVKANYIESGSSMNGQYNKSISVPNFRSSASSLGDNNETVWHTFSTYYNVIYLQYNLTDFSFIGNKFISSTRIYQYALDIEVGQGIVLISNQYYNFLLIVNATTQDPIQVYDTNSSHINFDLKLINGYINVVSCNGWNAYYCYHRQIPINYDLENLPTLTKSTSISFSVTNDYNFTNEGVSNYSLYIDADPYSYTFSEFSYTLQLASNESYVLSLPDSLDNIITVSPGQNISFDIPCIVDNFNGTFTACEVTDDAALSWVTIDCDNSLIQILESNQTETLVSEFSIKSTYQSVEILNNFTITIVPCDFPNCMTCADGACNSCYSGYLFNNESSFCDKENVTEYSVVGPTYNVTAGTVAVQAAAGAGAGAGLLSALLSNTSPQDIWAIVHIMQIILIFPLIVKSMSGKVQNFIASNAFSALSVYFIPLKVIDSTPVIRDLSFDQPDEYLKVLGWPSGSTLVNNIVLLALLFVVVIFHLLFCLLHHLTKNKNNKCSLMFKKVYDFFTFTIYIRILVEVYMFTVLMLVSEIKYYVKNGGDDNFGHHSEGESKKTKGNYASLIISCIIFILLSLFLVLTFISWKRNKDNLEIDNDCKTRELYNGMCGVPKRLLDQQKEKQKNNEAQDSKKSSVVPKDIRVARLYYLLFLARRMSMVLIIVAIPDSLFLLKMALLFVIQTICIGYAISIRSFASKKDQAVETFNECVIVVLMIIITKFNSENWTSTGENAFIGIILFQSWILLLVSMAGVVLKIIGFCKRSKKQPEQSSLEKDHDNHKSKEDCDDAQDDKDKLKTAPKNTPRVIFHYSDIGEEYFIINEESKLPQNVSKLSEEEKKDFSQNPDSEINNINDIDVILQEKNFETQNDNISQEQSKNPQNYNRSNNYNRHSDSCYSTNHELYQEHHVYPVEHNSCGQDANTYPDLVEQDKKDELKKAHSTIM